MLIQQLSTQCKDKGKVFKEGKVFLIQQNLNTSSDFLTVSWIIHELESERKVAFVAFRENYAHFLALSKKLGKSIEQYLKSKQLKYYECFQSSFCQSQFPLTQTSPNSYISPPTTVHKIKTEEIMKSQHLFEKNSTIIVDAISFIEEENEIIFKVYEQAMDKNCKIVLAGAIQGSQIAQLFKLESDLYIKLENDVGNHAKLRMVADNWEVGILWRHLQGKFQLTQHIKL